MQKKRQEELSIWLKQKSVVSSTWLNISKLLGIINGLLIIAQSWIIAHILNCIIIEKIPRRALLLLLVLLIIIFVIRSLIFLLREKTGFFASQRIRHTIRSQALDYLEKTGPIWTQSQSSGSWVTLIVEQIDDMHSYYANYLPQIVLSVCVPFMIAMTIFFINWISALILFVTAPLIPIFMIMIGMRAADANQRNFQALARLSGHFLDRLRGIDTIRLFWCGKTEIKNIYQASKNFRQHTMEVLRLAFLSSGVLEFFTSISIALIAIYFTFSYLGKLNFGYYGITVTLFSGILTLVLSQEFFRPLRDLGTFYHAKAQAIGAADGLKTMLETPLMYPEHGDIILNSNEPVMLKAENLLIFSPNGKILAGPLNFIFHAGHRIALVGISGSGKSSLLNVLLGFLPYRGSLQVNGTEVCNLDLTAWHKMLSLVGQTPKLISATLRENIVLAEPEIEKSTFNLILDLTRVNAFLPLLPHGIDTLIGDQGAALSVGQAQCVAIARALLHPCQLLLLDEPTASFDLVTKKHLMNVLNDISKKQSTLMITHQLNDIVEWDEIWVMDNGRITEQGNYTQLCIQKGIFSTLISSRQ